MNAYKIIHEDSYGSEEVAIVSSLKKAKNYILANCKVFEESPFWSEKKNVYKWNKPNTKTFGYSTREEISKKDILEKSFCSDKGIGYTWFRVKKVEII